MLKKQIIKNLTKKNIIQFSGGHHHIKEYDWRDD